MNGDIDESSLGYIYIYNLYLFTVYVYDTGIMLGLQREYNGN